jgi:hypothetical protein
LFAAKIALKIFQKLSILPGFKGETMTNKIAWLESQVTAKQIRQSPVTPRLSTATGETNS